MRAVLIMYDSLNKRMLPNYGNQSLIYNNFHRLGEKSVTFTNGYVGSMPCIPARRDLHTGRYNFLHRSWGPLEPFDISFPELLKQNGTFTYLVSDHYHYWEDGGATYHPRYSAWECIRGQEADSWIGKAAPPEIPEHLPTMREFTHPVWWRDNWNSRYELSKTDTWPQTVTFDKGLEFLENNKDEKNWFLQIETFDPHEPFNAPEEFLNLFEDGYDGPVFDWPPYGTVTEPPAAVSHIRNQYQALLGLCDQNLGRVLDAFDSYDLWKDTMLIVTTDHGFLLGEKDWWAKSVMPLYNEIAQIPFFIWDPRSGICNVKRKSLVQNIDIAPTILEAFGLEIPKEITGNSLARTIADDTPVRDAALFGFHGSFVNVTDGQYVLMKASESLSNRPLYEYTLMPTHQQTMFDPEELTNIEIVDPLPFTRGAQMMKIPAANRIKNATFCNSFQFGDLLWDLAKDPDQSNPIEDTAIHSYLSKVLVDLMAQSDAPDEQYVRLGLTKEGSALSLVPHSKFEALNFGKSFIWSQEMKTICIGMMALIPEESTNEFLTDLKSYLSAGNTKIVTRALFENLARKYYSENEEKVFYFLNKLTRIR